MTKNLKEILNTAKQLHYCSLEDLIEKAEIDIRVNDNGKWIEFNIDGMHEVVNIE